MPATQSLPLYIQTAEMLIRDIQSGRLMDGERLPPERAMAKGLGISVGTLRKALAELERKALLDRRQGSGNYVRHRADAESVYSFFRLELLQGGGLPTAEVLSVATMAKPGDLPEFGSSWMAHRIRRLRRLGGVPAAVEEIWLDASYSSSLRARELSESLYHFYKTRLGLWIQRAEDRIGLGVCPGWGAGLLDMSESTFVVRVERRSWDQDGQIAEFSRTWYDSGKVTYVSRIK